MREKLMRFMQGRYGSDRLSRFMMWVSVALIIVGIFIHSPIINALILIIIILTYLRMFSKNTNKRYAENLAYLRLSDKVRSFFKGIKTNTVQEKGFKVFACPSCSQRLRVPRGRGKITITCAKCGKKFTKKS